MSETPFTVFIALVTLDKNIIDHQAQIESLGQEIAQLSRDKHMLVEDAQATKQAWVTAQKEVDFKELEMASLDQQQQQKKRKLEAVTGVKEYQSIMAEIESLKNKQQLLEPALLQAWHKLETTTKIHEQKKKSFEESVNTIDRAVEEKKQQQEQIGLSIKQMLTQRDDRQKGVLPEWLEKYNMMHVKQYDSVHAGAIIFSPELSLYRQSHSHYWNE